MSSHYEEAQLLGSRVQLAGSQLKCRAEDMASLFSRGENTFWIPLILLHTLEPLILFISYCILLWPCYYGVMILYYCLVIFFLKVNKKLLIVYTAASALQY